MKSKGGFYKDLKSICLNSEGKGRVRYQKSRKLFSYESINDRKEKEWKVALHLPIIGEKRLGVSWSDGRERLKGSFIKILFNELKKSPNNKKQSKEVKKALSSFAKVISFLGQLDQDRFQACTSKETYLMCPTNSKAVKLKISKSKESLVIVPMINGRAQDYKLVALNLAASHFGRMSILGNDPLSYVDAPPFSLDLFIKSCQQ